MSIYLNPSILYFIVWSIVLILYSMRLSFFLLPFDLKSVIFLVGSIFSFLLGGLSLNLMTYSSVKKRIEISKYIYFLESEANKKRIKLLIVILFFGFSFATIYAGNFPIFSLLNIGSEIRYVDFGIPGIHGFFNSIFLSLCCIFFAQYLLCKKKNKIIFIFIFLWPILLMNRQLFISIFIEFLFIYLLLKEIKLYFIVKFFLLIIFIIFFFGYIGDFRFGRERFLILAQPTFDYPEFLPSGFMWVYMYITSPIVNIIHNINIQPNYIPLSIISGFFPSFIRSVIFSENSWVLLNDSFNVSSIHRKIIADFGILFGLIFYFYLSFFMQKIYRKITVDPRYGFVLIVLLHDIALSFFVDFLFHLVFLFQMIIFIFVFKND